MQGLQSSCSVPGPVLGAGHRGKGLGSALKQLLSCRDLGKGPGGLQLVAFCRVTVLLLLLKTWLWATFGRQETMFESSSAPRQLCDLGKSLPLPEPQFPPLSNGGWGVGVAAGPVLISTPLSEGWGVGLRVAAPTLPTGHKAPFAVTLGPELKCILGICPSPHRFHLLILTHRSLDVPSSALFSLPNILVA